MKLLLLIIAGLLTSQSFATLSSDKKQVNSQEDEIRQALLKLNSLNAKDQKQLGEDLTNADLVEELGYNQITNTNLNLKK